MRYLYAITNLVNGKKYVGIAADPQRRWWKHRNGPQAGGSVLVKRAIDKYGLDNFRFEILGQGDTKTIAWCEEQAILIFQSMVPNGYNLSTGGEIGFCGARVSPETAAKRAASNRGKKRSSECCQRISLAARKRPPRSLESDASNRRVILDTLAMKNRRPRFVPPGVNLCWSTASRSHLLVRRRSHRNDLPHVDASLHALQGTGLLSTWLGLPSKGQESLS